MDIVDGQEIHMLVQSVNRKLEGKVIGFKDKKKELEDS
jgi:hypothetical protein